MKKLLIPIVALLLVVSCRQRPEWVYPPHQYSPGQKVLLKTGDVAIILEYPPFAHAKYRKGRRPTSPIYDVRVGFSKRVSNTDSLLSGRRTVVTEVTRFRIREFEIEKQIE